MYKDAYLCNVKEHTKTVFTSNSLKSLKSASRLVNAALSTTIEEGNCLQLQIHIFLKLENTTAPIKGLPKLFLSFTLSAARAMPFNHRLTAICL